MAFQAFEVMEDSVADTFQSSNLRSRGLLNPDFAKNLTLRLLGWPADIQPDGDLPLRQFTDPTRQLGEDLLALQA